MSNYISGRNAEYTIKKLLISKGYIHIIRSAGSHTPIDLMASNGKRKLAIQVKRNRYISKEERCMLIKWAISFDATPILAKKVDGRWTFQLVSQSSMKNIEI